MYDVFISYARGTARTDAQALRSALLARDRTVFLDEREIPYGGAFPAEIAAGLRDSRVTVVFLDDRYVTRPFCVYELQVITALARCSRSDPEGATRHVIVALPRSGDTEALIAHLPPAVANRSWPAAGQSDVIASMAEERLAGDSRPLGERLSEVADDAVRRLRGGGQIPLPWAVPVDSTGSRAAPVMFTLAIPDSRGDGFVGREQDLWRVFDALVTPRAFGTPLGCTLQGPGGCGKSQLAAEFAWRYGRRFFPGGTVWIAADGGDSELTDQFQRLLSQLDGGAAARTAAIVRVEDRLSALRQALSDAFAARRGAPILWIVDGIPEPGPGVAAAQVQRWCPARDNVALLCTSRRAGIEGVRTMIELPSLTGDAAVALLTRPPVEAGWLERHEWSELARWVGELPLALAILRDSLTNGFTTVKALARSRGQEPAVVLDTHVDALRGEVADPYLRGVAEAFELSYARLADPSELREAAHLFSRLASSPIPEELVATLVSSPLVGRLAKRSWIQPSGGAGGRRWAMHQIPASFLRSRSPSPSAEYARLFTWLTELVSTRSKWLHDHGSQTHLRIIANEFAQNVAAADAATIATDPAVVAARAFALEAAAVDLADRELRGVRYVAAGVAQRTGVGHEVVARIGDPEQLNAAAAAGVAYLLGALPDSEAAAGLMERLLGDPRPEVCQAAIVHARGTPFLAVGIAQLRAFFAIADADAQEGLSPSLDWILAPENPRLADVLDSVLDVLATGDVSHRTAAARVLQRVLIIHQDDGGLARHRRSDIRNRLLTAALTAIGTAVADAAADAAGVAFDPGDLVTLQQAQAAASDDHEHDAAVAVLARYMASGQRPRPPRARATWGRDGSLQLQAQLGAEGAVPATAYTMLLESLRRVSTQHVRLQVMRVLAHTDGAPVVGAEIDRLIASGAFEDALALGDSFVAMSRGVVSLVVNGNWWRGMALEALDRMPEAAAAYDTAIAAAPRADPAVVPLRERRAIARIANRAFTEALEDLDFAIGLAPRSFRAHHVRSLCLYNLERHSEAQEAAERAIAIDDSVGEAWFFRAVACYAQGEVQGAVADLERSVALAPHDERAISFLEELRAYLAQQSGGASPHTPLR